MPVVRRRSTPTADLRVGIVLIGTIDGINVDFTAGELWIESSPTAAIAVYWNGVRQTQGEDYTVSTSGPVGTGETVSLLEAPRPGDRVTADYTAA